MISDLKVAPSSSVLSPQEVAASLLITRKRVLQEASNLVMCGWKQSEESRVTPSILSVVVKVNGHAR